jgi:hypothetical protein
MPVALPSTPLAPTDRPLILLPVRIETRFFSSPAGSYTLKIRVYPDTIHVDTHEPGVTASEAEWGRHYWRTIWRASTDTERRKAAWRQLAERYESQRASWIAWHLRPLNPDDSPDSPIGPEDPLTPEPRFPEPPQLNIQTEPWTRAPWSCVLPDRWIAIGYVSGNPFVVAQGNPISDPLAMGPDPNSEIATPDDQAPVDDGMKWMVDFDEAVRVGMGLELALPDNSHALDRLLVFGAKGSLDSDASAERLSKLAQAHSYTHGFSFLAQGMPSNNTAEASSGFSSFDPGYESSFEANQAQGDPGDAANGAVVAKALGIPAATFARIERSRTDDLSDARHMNTALWQTTWGYFLEQMVNDALPPQEVDAVIAWVRRQFIDHVRAGGPLPAIRCGRQPYGLLPVSSIDLWALRPEDGTAVQRIRELHSVVSRLRGVWMRASEYAPRVGRTADLRHDLLEVLRQQATSNTVAIRSAIGRHYFQNLWQFQLVDLGGFGYWSRLEQLVSASIRNMGFENADARVKNNLYSAYNVPLKGPLVQPGVVAEDTRLAPNYAELLLNSSVAGIRDEAFPDPKPRSVLYAILRHSAMLEYTKAAQNILIGHGLMSAAQRGEEEIVNVESGPAVFTPRMQLGTVVPDVSPQPLEVFLQQLTSFTDPAVEQLGEFRTSLQRLSKLTVPELEHLLTGALDLCSYRLDAWITSLATTRLMAMRQANPKGAYIGAYGWVENLHVGPPRATATTVEEESTPPPFELPGNPGFIHAPSIPHAATAAVLRSGRLTHENVESGKVLDIDLSSARVRLAKWLLDGVRGGQPLGALLGYRFERGLHESHPGVELDLFIARFRQMAPLAPATLHPAGDAPVESIAANNVVDGLRLQYIWRAAATDEASFFAQLGAMSDEQKQALRAELAALDEAVDAVSDALLAESVHQAVLGNHSCASATLDSVARGDARPPELDVIQTPRSGIALTHRLLVLFNLQETEVHGWPGARFPFRAAAEPRVNAWAGQLLGDPARVRCRVERFDPATGEVLDTRELRIADLGLAPLDFVYAAESSAEVKRSEIEQRLILEALRQASGFGPDEALRVNLDRDPSWPLRDLSGSEFFELLRAVRAVIMRARGIDGRDLAATGVSEISGIDEAELSDRASRAIAFLESTLGQLRSKLESAPEALGEALLPMAHFGIPGAIPSAPAHLVGQARSVEREATSRLARAKAAVMPLDALREVFGASFVVAAVFSPPNAPELTKSWQSSDQLQNGKPMEAAAWLARAARVREGTARLEDAFRYAEALGAEAELNLRVGQLPYRENDRWVALPLAGGKPLSAGALSLVAQTGGGFDPAQPFAGLLIDEWIETVPNATETTGVVFQYDQPDATPPQSVLIAIPPGADLAWTAEALGKVLLETMDLAKMRMVDPSLLGEIQHFLPALYFASNTEADTVSTDWHPLRRYGGN